MTFAFDIVLILGLLVLAWRALASPDLFTGIVLFIAFGLLLSLVWVRLNAPDVALAEAAVGSGLTGALLLSTLGRLKRMDEDEGIKPAAPRRGGAMAVATQTGLAAVAGLLGWAVLSLPAESVFADPVQESLDASGVGNPVTAVLLNFRAYDTLLEIAVLSLAVAAVWSLATVGTARDGAPARLAQTVVVHLLAPVMVVAAGYLLWTGTNAPGGAFQAGAILGGVGVLLVLSRPDLAVLREGWALRLVLVAGTLVFLAVGALVMPFHRFLLEYPPQVSGSLILVIETAATLSIGATLAVLFLGGRPAAAKPRPHD